ncbi:MAG TPA: VWA domain-containing protein [Luteitalea sp.]|nr:VWA domain-containing protein [Luteitalea sp.]
MWTQYLVLAIATAFLAVGQDRPRPDAQTFRVTTERIQFDALFLDSRKRPVTDIRPDEVTVRQAGTLVPLMDLRFYARTAAATPPSPAPTKESSRGTLETETAPSRAPATSTDEGAWVFLIDDLAMSPDGFARAKAGLLAMLAGDVPSGVAIGILRTGVIGTHQTRLSSSRSELARSVAGMQYKANRWRGGLMSRSGATVAGPNRGDTVYVEGTLGSLNSLVLSLRPLSGRKVVFVLSELIALTAVESDVPPGGAMRTVVWDVKYNGTAARLRRLGKLAGEAGVTVHTIDLAGVTAASSNDRAFQDEGLHAVADELGGLYFGASNDVGPLLEKVVAAEQGYYVLAYEPPTGTFDDGGKAKFVDVDVTVSRPGVNVRTRRGFFTR